MADRIKLRRDTAANWTATNPVLAQGEPGFETDTDFLKVGDGVTAWNALSYVAGVGAFVPLAGNVTMVGPLSVPANATGAQVPQAQETYGPKNGQLAGMRNKIINGNFDVWQRGTVFAGSLGAVVYTADRWGFYCTGAVMYPYQGTGLSGTGSAYSLCVNGASGNTATTFLQRIEAANMQHPAGTSMTVSLKVVSGDSRNIQIYVNSANTKDNFSAATVVTSQIKAVVSGVNTVSITFTTTTACANGVEVGISFGAVTTGTFGIGQVQLEIGAVATPFEHRLYGAELALCQRRCWVINGSSLETNQIGIGVSPTSTTNCYILVNPPVTFAATPTVTVVGQIELRGGGVIQPATLAGGPAGSVGPISLSANSTGLTVGAVYVLRLSSDVDNKIIFSCEL